MFHLTGLHLAEGSFRMSAVDYASVAWHETKTHLAVDSFLAVDSLLAVDVFGPLGTPPMGPVHHTQQSIRIKIGDP